MATTLQAISAARSLVRGTAMVWALVLLPFAAGAQSSAAPPPASPAPASPTQDQGGYRIKKDVDLVVLHATVLDHAGQLVPDLRRDDFHVFEDKVEQKLALFRREDIPVTLGLVIDNSGSMREKRPRVNAAALTFVRTSNPQDEVFVVNFNDQYFLDLDKDFTSDPKDLKEALDRIDSRGSTAFYDALVGSLDHLKKGTKDKKVLLVVTDGEDNASREKLADAVRIAQHSNALIYAIGLFAEDDRREKKHATKALQEITEATGGLAYFPKEVSDVESICAQIAHDIRNQYTLAYYPVNAARDGTFRTVQVIATAKKKGKLTVRTRTGYFAQKAPSAD